MGYSVKGDSCDPEMGIACRGPRLETDLRPADGLLNCQSLQGKLWGESSNQGRWVES